MLALLHRPSPNMQRCERTHVPETAIDAQLAEQQHSGYAEALRASGADVRVLDRYRELPDCAFIEDTAIVLDEVAVLCPMGVASRRAESTSMEPVLRELRPVVRIELPATIEGGDVLRVGRRLLVGLSSRTNTAGIAALEAIAAPYGYTVEPVPVHQCLHLKTACTALPDGRLLINPRWIDTTALGKWQCITVPEDEPWSANVAIVSDHVLLAAGQPRTAALIESLGFRPRAVELSEFAKAEGGVTCLSLLVS